MILFVFWLLVGGVIIDLKYMFNLENNLLFLFKWFLNFGLLSYVIGLFFIGEVVKKM